MDQTIMNEIKKKEKRDQNLDLAKVQNPSEVMNIEEEN